MKKGAEALHKNQKEILIMEEKKDQAELNDEELDGVSGGLTDLAGMKKSGTPLKEQPQVKAPSIGTGVVTPGQPKTVIPRK